MRVRVKNTDTTGTSTQFNIHALSEVVVYFDEGAADSMYQKDLDVEINGEWKDMNQAFKDKDIIPDNFNTQFGVPNDEESKERGWRRN